MPWAVILSPRRRSMLLRRPKTPTPERRHTATKSLSSCQILFAYVLTMVLTLSSPTSIVADDWWRSVEEIDPGTSLVIHRGRYWNPTYLYSFMIPESLICLSDPAPAPHHGCGIHLSEHPRAYIW